MVTVIIVLGFVFLIMYSFKKSQDLKERLEKVKNGYLTPIKSNQIMLKNEDLFYFEKGCRKILKTVNVGSKSNGNRVRITKSFSISSGTRQNIRGTISDEYNGIVFITNKTFGFVGVKGFTENINNIISIVNYCDGVLIQTNKREYMINTNFNPLFEVTLKQVINQYI